MNNIKTSNKHDNHLWLLGLGAALLLIAFLTEEGEQSTSINAEPIALNDYGIPNGTGTYDDLTELFRKFELWKDYKSSGSNAFHVFENVPDYSPATIERRQSELGAMQARLQDMSVIDWSVPEKVDYLTVRAEIDQQQFIHHVTRPWSRDPMFYITGLLATAFTDLPAADADLENLKTNLQLIPSILAAARSNLTEVAGDYADLAIRSLTMSDGVEDGYPYREQPRAGVIGWYEDLLGRSDVQPMLQNDIKASIDALRGFHNWLVTDRSKMDGQNGVGKKALDWFVQNALLLPYTSEEMSILSERELERMWAFYALEQHRNRNLPEIQISSSREEYQGRIEETDGLVRNWLVDESFISIPDHIPLDWREMGYNVPFIVRATPPNFWEQVQFRDPAPDHLHAVIPGHRFDAKIAEKIPHPIRSAVNFGGRWQGWAVYLEEASLQAGILEARPRTRELIYLFGLWRAARSNGDILNQWNEMTAAETSQYWLKMTPLLDPNVARKYAYLRPAPGHGLEYTIGNIQMFRLLAERKRQLADKFNLKEFHDEFISKGRIPISLIRYEMTGYEKDVEEFWNRPPISSILAE